MDSGGLESAYRDSALLTVSKPMYYWSKYNSDITNYYSEGTWAPGPTDAFPWEGATINTLAIVLILAPVYIRPVVHLLQCRAVHLKVHLFTVRVPHRLCLGV